MVKQMHVTKKPENVSVQRKVSLEKTAGDVTLKTTMLEILLTVHASVRLRDITMM